MWRVIAGLRLIVCPSPPPHPTPPLTHPPSNPPSARTSSLPPLRVQAAEGRACVVVVNKWDTVKTKTDRTMKDYEDNVRAEVRRNIEFGQ